MAELSEVQSQLAVTRSAEAKIAEAELNQEEKQNYEHLQALEQTMNVIQCTWEETVKYGSTLFHQIPGTLPAHVPAWDADSAPASHVGSSSGGSSEQCCQDGEADDDPILLPEGHQHHWMGYVST